MNASLMELLQCHHSDSWGWALSCCEWRQSLAEDVLQEAYLRVLDGNASEKTWFFAVIRRVSAEARRQQRRQSLLSLRFLQAANDEPEADLLGSEAGRTQSSEQLRQALSRLSQRQREVLHLVFYSGLTLEEAADTLGLGLGSVRTHYHRGKTRLAELMETDNE